MTEREPYLVLIVKLPLLKTWGEQGVEHGGAILVDGRTMAPSDIGSLLQALGLLWQAEKNRDWRNLVIYLLAKQRLKRG